MTVLDDPVGDLKREVAELQRRLAERESELAESVAQQAAISEVLQVINSSPGDLAPVFDVLLERARRLCQADVGALWTFEDGRFHASVVSGMEAAVHPAIQPSPQLPLGRVMLGEDVVHVVDVMADPAYKVDAAALARATAAGGRSILAVTLRKDGRLLGAITTGRRTVRPFTEEQISLLQNFAAQAVIAMENARLITETREALEQQTATAEVLGVINSSPGDLAPVFHSILEKAHSLCGADFGGLLLFDGASLRPAAQHNMPPRFTEVIAKGFRPGPESNFARLQRGETFAHVQDFVEAVARAPDDPVARAAVEIAGIRTQLLVPLRKDDEVLGVITANRREVRPFTEKQIALLQNFAAQAVIAMENARLLGELRRRTDEVADLNRGLEARVAEQVEELGRVGRLKRFLAPQLAELIVSRGDEKILESHRREIVVVFCDLRGYTAFTETAEPEEVLDFLREYHGALGPLVSQFEGTLDQFSGDGIMVFFNDPVPVPDPAERAVKMAIAMRETANRLIATWRRRDRELGFGVGIAQGYATLGQIGFADRSGYTAIGTVCNLAARLCAEAKESQILVTGRVASAVEESTALEDIGPLVLRGLTQPVSVFNVKGLMAC